MQKQVRDAAIYKPHIFPKITFKTIQVLQVPLRMQIYAELLIFSDIYAIPRLK